MIVPMAKTTAAEDEKKKIDPVFLQAFTDLSDEKTVSTVAVCGSQMSDAMFAFQNRKSDN